MEQQDKNCLQRVTCHLLRLVSMMLVVFPSIVRSLSSNELCSSKVCSGCLAGSLSCQEGGLTRLPDSLSSDIRSIILIGHRFQQPLLMAVNFTTFSSGTIRLQRLTLRNCGIDSVQPGAFNSLRNLKQLDLSKNRIRSIKSDTFSGLDLEFLRLDENTELHLAPGAFIGATISSLSINQCGLQRVLYEDLAPLVRLKSLQLSGNHIQTIDERLNGMFYNLEHFAIDQNPFVCDCRIRWLPDILQRLQLKQEKGKRNDQDDFQDFTLVRSGSDNSQLNDAPTNDANMLEGDLMKPLCHAPARLSGWLLESLRGADFFCDVPRLHALEIELEPSVDLSNHSLNAGALIANRDQYLSLKMRCHMKGSPEMEVSWYRRRTSQEEKSSTIPSTFELDLEDYTRVQEAKSLEKGVIELDLVQPISNGAIYPNVPAGNIWNQIEQFFCVASDPNGNISTAVNIKWPNNEMHKHLVDVSKTSVSGNGNKGKGYPVAEVIETDKDSRFIGDSHGTSGNVRENLEHEESLWYKVSSLMSKL